ncbi:hypothetical protein C3L33_22690, partial [Rhododendron williamsianum]
INMGVRNTPDNDNLDVKDIATGKRGMVLPFQPLSLAFDHVNYYVDMPAEMKSRGIEEARLQLLQDVSGAFRPGVLTALVGVIGAGKTTLMDVLAGRKTGGYIEGCISISGFPKNQATFARISGYCEQNDIHSPHVTVHESIVYSAWLRLAPDVNKETRKDCYLSLFSNPTFGRAKRSLGLLIKKRSAENVLNSLLTEVKAGVQVNLQQLVELIFSNWVETAARGFRVKSRLPKSEPSYEALTNAFLRATTSSSGLSSFSAIYNSNNNNNHQKYLRTVPSSISSMPTSISFASLVHLDMYVYIFVEAFCFMLRAGPRRGLSIECGVRFRPCIDIHKVTKVATHVNVNWLFHLVVLLEEWLQQIFRSVNLATNLMDLKEGSSTPVTNFESDKSAAEYANIYKEDGLTDKSAAEYANIYKEDGLTGGHVIMIGADPFSKSAAMEALHAYPGGLHVGGGINPDNALSYIEGGASHVIITSVCFHSLLPLFFFSPTNSYKYCDMQEGKYAIVTDRWQKFTDVFLDEKIMDFLATYADEFLVHGVDVEGKKLGIDEELVTLLGSHSPIPVTYAGGVTVMSDLERIKAAGMERVDVTVGSALDIFGGNLAYKDVVGWHAQQQALAV